MVIHACNTNYSEGGGRWTVIQVSVGKNVRPKLKSKLKTKGLARHQLLTHVILGTQEAEMRRIAFQSQQGK
jgi:hypothetical protein